MSRQLIVEVVGASVAVSSTWEGSSVWTGTMVVSMVLIEVATTSVSVGSTVFAAGVVQAEIMINTRDKQSSSLNEVVFFIL